MFNPLIRTFRMHLLSVRPSVEFCIPELLSGLGSRVLAPGRYYESDYTEHDLNLTRLGRRARVRRLVPHEGGMMQLHAHGFWRRYFAKVASEDYRGYWRGLAPMKVDFHSSAKVLANPAFVRDARNSLAPGLEEFRVAPYAYICPIGWAVGVRIEVTGALHLTKIARIVHRLFGSVPERPFLHGGAVLGPEGVLTHLHLTVAQALFRDSQIDLSSVPIFRVAGILQFDEELEFTPTDVDDPTALLLLTIIGGEIAQEGKRIVTADRTAYTATVFDRGTILIPSKGIRTLPYKDRQCLQSNLKNILMMTFLMQRFHHDARGHTDKRVKSWRNEVAITFGQMKSHCSFTHFRHYCGTHKGAQIMVKESEDSKSGKYVIGGQNVNIGAVGDGAQGIVSLQPGAAQVAWDLARIQQEVAARATTDRQQADVALLDKAKQEAEIGNLDTAKRYLQQLSEWGVAAVKEIGTTLASEAVKRWLGWT